MKYFMRFDFKKENLYRYIKATLFVLAISVVVSQFALGNDNMRKYLTSVDILDGTLPVGSDMVQDGGYVKLKLLKGEPGQDIIILVNGDEYSKFLNNEIMVEIKGQSVIEVLNKSKKSVAVTVDELSGNVSATFNNGVVYVDDISVITRVVLK